jgi:hypothetical protein
MFATVPDQKLTLSGDAGGLSFSAVHLLARKSAFVLATPNFPFPHEPYCYLAQDVNWGPSLQQGGLLTQKVPLALLARPSLVLNFHGRPVVRGDGTLGIFTWQLKLTLVRGLS